MAAGLSVGLDRWRREFDELMLRVGGRFARVEPRRRMAAFVRGLLAGLPRVNCWSIAEHAGEAGPRGMQRLLSAAVWDEAGMRDDLRGYVLEHFADPVPCQNLRNRSELVFSVLSLPKMSFSLVKRRAGTRG
jgi:hypothetical protein